MCASSPDVISQPEHPICETSYQAGKRSMDYAKPSKNLRVRVIRSAKPLPHLVRTVKALSAQDAVGLCIFWRLQVQMLSWTGEPVSRRESSASGIVLQSHVQLKFRQQEPEQSQNVTSSAQRK